MILKKLWMSVLLVLIGITTTGCMKAVMRFEPDGSGQFEIGFNLSFQALEQASDLSNEGTGEDFEDITPLLDSGEIIIEEKTGIGVSAEERLQNGSMWTYVIFHVPTIEAWNMIDTASSRVLGSDEDSDSPADPTDLANTPTVTLEDGVLRVEMNVPATGSSPEDDPFGFTALVQMSYEIEMPGALIEHNGQIDSLTGNPVWLVDMTGQEDLEIFVEAQVQD